ncbi:MAG: hypothetical protein ACI9S8_001261 [Chlamydiales bacterium]|jgi:hypothetical protein
MTAISADPTNIHAYIEYHHPCDGSRKNFVSFFSDGNTKFACSRIQQEYEEQGLNDPCLKKRNIQRVYPEPGSNGIRFQEVFIEFEYAVMNRALYHLTVIEASIVKDIVKEITGDLNKTYVESKLPEKDIASEN